MSHIVVKVRLETSREHVAEPARRRDPAGAFEEPAWNAFDALTVTRWTT
jgi:hypothetical protein